MPSSPNVTAAAGVNQVTLSWNAVASATSYKVYQNGTALTPSETITTPSHTVTGLTAGTSYSFKVKAVNSVGESGDSNEVMATPLPPAVTGFSATAGVEQVTLTWTASADTAVTAYTIRTTGGESSIADVAIAGRIPTSGTVGTVTGLSIGVEYSFTIVAVAGSTESAQSDAVTATPTPPAVAGLTATAGVEQVALAWTASTHADVTGYKIRQTVDGTENGNRRKRYDNGKPYRREFVSREGIQLYYCSSGGQHRKHAEQCRNGNTAGNKCSAECTGSSQRRHCRHCGQQAAGGAQLGCGNRYSQLQGISGQQ